MQTIRYKTIELFLLFIFIPVSFIFDYWPILKLIIGILSFIYIVYIIVKIEKIKFNIKKSLRSKKFWKSTFIKFLVIAILTTIFVWFTEKENLFTVAITKPKMWISILFFYSLFSVYPQEILYRTFFFKRYEALFKNEIIFILTNAILFALAHIFFKNVLVLSITFIGGLLFAFTYKKTKSTLLVSIEHAIYGCWLFTVGMGNMLGFPS